LRLQILAAALLFSTGGAAIKAVSLSNWQVASFRSGVAALTLLLLLPGVQRALRPGTLAVGMAYAATMTLFVSANKLTTAVHTIFLQATAPLYLLLLGPWLLGEPVRRRDVLYTAALAAGMGLLLVGGQPQAATAPRPLLGNILAAASGVTWALTIGGLRWLGRDRAGERRAEAAVVAGNVMACLACLPLALPVLSSTPQDWLLVLYLGTCQIGLAYYFLTRAVRHLPALEVSLLLLLEPVLNALWAWLVHGERPGGWALGGCVAILLATLARTLRAGG
jgi:drug/metabolite transporter (DMT)-like permease